MILNSAEWDGRRKTEIIGFIIFIKYDKLRFFRQSVQIRIFVK